MGGSGLCGAVRRRLCPPFPSPAMAEEFRAHRMEFAFRFAHFVCAVYFVMFLLILPLRMWKFGWFLLPDANLGLHLVPLVISASSFLTVKYAPPSRRRAEPLVFLTAGLLLAFNAFNVHQQTTQGIHLAKVGLQDVWAVLGDHPEAARHLETHITAEVSRRAMWCCLAATMLVFNVLQFLGLSPWALLLYVTSPVAFVLVVFLSPQVSNDVVEPLLCTGVVALYCVGSSCYVLRQQRRQFEAAFALRETLEKEAKTLEAMAQQERAHKKATEQADTILQHILKNIMADAASCIHLYSSSLSSAAPPDLAEAATCLERGMAWCHKRHAILQVMAGHYRPHCTPTHLPAFGAQVVRARAIRCAFPDRTVDLDPTLCEIVFDNALNNAFRHGHPTDPRVEFTMRFEPASEPLPEGHQLLTLTVANRAHPQRPPITAEFISDVLKGLRRPASSGSSLSQHLGLQHMFLAAAAHGMALDLQQRGDRVVLNAALAVRVAAAGDGDAADEDDDETILLPRLGTFGSRQMLPTGLKIYCLDDSPIARRLVAHAFQQHAPTATVHAFGAEVSDVERFVQEAGQSADIVVLDCYLEYDSMTYFGTDVLKQLFDAGYQGLVCMRSANVSAANEQDFLRQGAHCAIGKDVPPSALVACVRDAYLSLQQSQSLCLTPSSRGMSILSPSSLDRFLHTPHSPPQSPRARAQRFSRIIPGAMGNTSDEDP
eukprot:EG_transcript_3106